MDELKLAPGEYMEQCPYNKSHMIINTKFLTHLTKCRDTYKKEMKKKGEKVDIIKCRFNSTHHHIKIEMEHHEKNCPDKGSIIAHLLYHESDDFKAMEAQMRQAINGIQSMSLGGTSSGWGNNLEDGGENWDEDCRNDYAPAYDPQIKLNSGAYLVNPMGLKPAERRKHRKESCRKARELLELEEKEKHAAARPSAVAVASVSNPAGVVAGASAKPEGAAGISAPVGNASKNVPTTSKNTGYSAAVRGRPTETNNNTKTEEPKKEEESGDYDWFEH